MPRLGVGVGKIGGGSTFDPLLLSPSLLIDQKVLNPGHGRTFQNLTNTAATADGHALGLLHERSQSVVIGAELVSNAGNPFAVTTGWTSVNGSLAVVSGELEHTRDVSFWCSTPVTTVVGKLYRFSGSFYKSAAPTAAYLRAGTSIGGTENSSFSSTSTSPDTKVGYFVATATTTYISFGCDGSSGDKAYLVGVSVKLVSGNHPSQTTAASKPTLKFDSSLGKWYMSFDGGDVLNLPAAVSASAATIITVGSITGAATQCAVNIDSYNLYLNVVSAQKTAAWLNALVTSSFDGLTRRVYGIRGRAANDVDLITNLTKEVKTGGASLYTAGDPCIGGSAVAAERMTGRLDFVAVYPQALADADLDRVIRYAARDVGVAL